MLSKSRRPYDPAKLPVGQRLKRNIGDLFAGNELSGNRTQELIDDCDAAGASGLKKLRSRRGPRNSKKISHCARNLTRRLLKSSQWPDLYEAPIRVIDIKTQTETTQSCAFILPHHYVHVLSTYGNVAKLLDASGLDPVSTENWERSCRSAGGPCIPIGLWGDGMPVNYDRSESFEVISMNFPGLHSETGFSTMRLPITGLARKQIGPNTWWDIMQVISWSLKFLFVGIHPLRRHDGSEWCDRDLKRCKIIPGRPMLGKGALVEIRGDWKFFGELFSLPKHNENRGICWRCTCTPQQVTK